MGVSFSTDYFFEKPCCHLVLWNADIDYMLLPLIIDNTVFNHFRNICRLPNNPNKPCIDILYYKKKAELHTPMIFSTAKNSQPNPNIRKRKWPEYGIKYAHNAIN